MPFLHGFDSKNNSPGKDINSSEVFAVYYHNIFEYPLTFPEIIKWTPKNAPKVSSNVDYKNGFYFIKGREGLIYKRVVRKRLSQKKLKITKRASKIISLIPAVKMIGLTGSLAMGNAEKNSDIDLLIIAKRGRLWSSRVFTYLLLKLFGFKLRSPGTSKQKDRLCLNIWLDESNLLWSKKDRNFFTAHEILQIVPLFNKERTYEYFLARNRWALDFWPNAVEIRPVNKDLSHKRSEILDRIESLAYKIQYLYMRRKITNEIVTPTRAVFHPNNLSKKVTSLYNF